MLVGRREPDGERDALAVDHQMALRARCAAMRRVGAGRVAPRWLGCSRYPGRRATGRSGQPLNVSGRPRLIMTS